MIMTHYYWVDLSLWLTSLIAGIVDTLAGGGGLITIPALMIAGLPPTVALGTNKLQALVGELNASIHFMRHGKIKVREIFLGLFFVAIGASFGAICVQHVHPHILSQITPFLTLAVLLYMIFFGKVTAENRQSYLSLPVFYCLFGLSLGFYNGFFGPATGSFWITALVIVMGFNLKKAMLYGKPLNCMGNLTSISYFIYAGLIHYQIAFIMATGQLIGSLIGANFVIKKDIRIIRPIFIVLVALLTCILFIRNH